MFKNFGVYMIVANLRLAMSKNNEGAVMSSWQEIHDFLELCISSRINSRFERTWDDMATYEIATRFMGMEPNSVGLYNQGNGNFSGICYAGEVCSKFCLDGIEATASTRSDAFNNFLRGLVGFIHYNTQIMTTEIMDTARGLGLTEIRSGFVGAMVDFFMEHERAHREQSMEEFSPMSEIASIQQNIGSQSWEDDEFAFGYQNQAQEFNANMVAFTMNRGERSSDRKNRLSRSWVTPFNWRTYCTRS